MAVVKARDQVTIAIGVDVASVDIYYKLQPSTSAAPLKPTTANPSEWTTTEPTYNDGSTNTLYTCQKTTLTDGTFYWSAVSKSTSYEAAKTAWNIANNTQQNLNNLRVGGANLIVHNTTNYGRLAANGDVSTGSGDGANHRHTDPIPVIGGETYILSWFLMATASTKSYLYAAWFDSEDNLIFRQSSTTETIDNIYNLEPSYFKMVAPETAVYAVINIPSYISHRCATKFEQGSVPTDLTLSDQDRINPSNVLRGTNQPDVLLGFNDANGTWKNGLWRLGSGTETSGGAEIIDIDDCEDSRQRYGFKVWSTTTGNKDVGQAGLPWKPSTETEYRICGFVRLTPDLDQTSATLQFRIYAGSALKSYTLAVTSEEWVWFSYGFGLSAAQVEQHPILIIGVKGKGSLEYCGLYLKEGISSARISLGEEHIPWEPAIEDYATYASTVSHLSQIDTNFQVLEESIESKVDATDVYSKNTIDGMFSTEVTNRNTAISQTQTAIEQHVSETYSTKTGTTQMMRPNLAPYFGIAKTDTYDATSNLDGYWKRISDNSQFTTYDMQVEYNGSGGWAHFAGSVSSGSPYVRFEPIPIATLKPSTDYTFMVEVNIVSAASTITKVALNLCEGDLNTDAIDPFAERVAKNLIDVDGMSYCTVSTRADLSDVTVLSRSYLQINGTGAFDIYLRISLYEGSYNGLYKPYVDPSLSSRVSHAEAILSVHATEIDARVEKDGVIAAINASVEESGGSAVKIQADKVEITGAAVFKAVNGRDGTTKIDGGKVDVSSITVGDLSDGDDYATKTNLDELVSVRLTMTRDSWTDAQWATYEAIGYQTDWTNGHFDKNAVQTSTGLSSDDLRVGDLIVVSGVSKDTGNTHSVVIRVRVAPASSTAKISAETVSFNNSLQMADYIQVGGENLLRKTASVTATDLARTRSTVPEAGIIRLTPTSSASYAKFIVDYLDFDEYGEGSYTVSFDARLANVTTSYTNMNVGIYLGYSTASRTGVVFSSSYDNYCPMKVFTTSLTNEWVRYSGTVDIPSDLTSGKAAARVAGSQLTVELAVGGSRKPVEVRHVKLERGTKATDWTPAQNDIDSAITDASKTATNYVTDISNDGIWITPSDAKPDANGDEIAGTTTGWHISNVLEMFRQGTSMFKIWVEETVAKMRLGAENLSHLLFEESEIKFCNSTDWVGKFGLTSQEQGDGYLHRIDFDVNDGTEQGGGYGLHLQYNTDSGQFTSGLGSRIGGLFYSTGYDGGVNIIGPNVFLSADSTTTPVVVPMANFIHAFGVVLFTGTYANTHNAAVYLAIDGTPVSAENFAMFKVFYQDSDGQVGSVDIDSPNNKTFSVTTSTATEQYLYFKSKTFKISGTSITCNYINSTYYRHGQARIGNNNATVYSQSDELIGIIKVIGYY